MKNKEKKSMKAVLGIQRGALAYTPLALQRKQGVALFIAISMLALFSLLGASYMRFMSLELDESNLRIRNIRVRQYAAAGIYSTMGHIQTTLAADQAPPELLSFSYPVYGGIQEKNQLNALSTYTAEATVTIKALDQNAWNHRFPAGPVWPGEMRAFDVLSAAEVQRAVPGGIMPMASHAVRAILIAQDDGLELLHWSAAKADAKKHEQ